MRIPNSKILLLDQVAWWWLPKSMVHQPDKSIWADLPGIQRGFVWNANQIERLWDSITRGFPIGSILLQETNKATDSADMMLKFGSEKMMGEPLPENCSRYLILDGQQRATSIAMGFKNVWDNNSADTTEKNDWRTLWIDIHNESKPKDERQFLFKLTSQAHPWGYASEVEASAHPRRIHAQDMRDAMIAYKFIYGHEANGIKPHEVMAHVAFPWDSRAPVPLAFILELLMAKKSKGNNEEIAKGLFKKVSQLPFQTLNNHIDSGIVFPDAKIKKRVVEKLDNIRDILTNPKSDQANQFNAIVDGLRKALAETEIPAPVLRGSTLENNNNNNNNDEKDNDERDPAFNLFERINTAGTRLTREEINYSMLKFVWKDAALRISTLLQDRWLTHPARLVSLLSRLLLTFPEDKSSKEDALHDALSIAQFRNEIHMGGEHPKSGSENLKSRLEKFCNPPEQEMWSAEKLLEKTWKLLTEGEWALPSVLAANITQSNENLILLLMAWLHRLERAGCAADLSVEVKKRALGCITAIHWFAPDASACVRILGKKLLSYPENELTIFFDKKISYLLERESANPQKQVMIPLPDVMTLKNVLESAKDDTKDSIWSLYFDKSNEQNAEVNTWVNQMSQISGGNDDEKEHYRTLASKFLQAIIVQNKRLVLYAQASIVNEWFIWFDPTKIERVTDHNAPWDFDHILPWSWVGRERISPSVPKMVRIWVNSNGNFRVWPAEYNRSKGDQCLIEDKLPAYGLDKKEDVYKASFINYPDDWKELDALEGRDDFWDKDKNNKLFEKFVKAAIHRTIDIYSHWYNALEIRSLH